MPKHDWKKRKQWTEVVYFLVQNQMPLSVNKFLIFAERRKKLLVRSNVSIQLIIRKRTVISTFHQKKWRKGVNSDESQRSLNIHLFRLFHRFSNLQSLWLFKAAITRLVCSWGNVLLLWAPILETLWSPYREYPDSGWLHVSWFGSPYNFFFDSSHNNVRRHIISSKYIRPPWWANIDCSNLKVEKNEK